MSLQLVKAGTSDALTLNDILRRAFDSDVFVGGPSAGGPPGYMSVSFHTGWHEETSLLTHTRACSQKCGQEHIHDSACSHFWLREHIHVLSVRKEHIHRF